MAKAKKLSEIIYSAHTDQNKVTLFDWEDGRCKWVEGPVHQGDSLANLDYKAKKVHPRRGGMEYAISRSDDKMKHNLLSGPSNSVARAPASYCKAGNCDAAVCPEGTVPSCPISPGPTRCNAKDAKATLKKPKKKSKK